MRILRRFKLLVNILVFSLLLLYSCRKETPVPQGQEIVHPSQEKEVKELYYCPMHPTYTSDKPGDCPICGMKLVKKETTKEAKPMEMAPGEVMISPEKQQLIGLTTGLVEYRSLSKVIRTGGRVEYDERKLAQVSSRIGGRIDKLFVNFTGAEVKKGEPLLSLYSPELVSAQEEYLLAKETLESAGSLAESARRKLLLWGITETQIEELEKTKKVQDHLTIYSPQSGVVTMKHVKEGMYVEEGMVLFEIADLTKVWVYGDFYEYEIPFLKVGQKAEVSLSYYPGEMFKGKVSFVFPYLESDTRTVKVRIELPNLHRKLKPGMYANIDLKIDLGEKLAVPEDAVLDSGKRKVVFLAKQDGHFEPREVELGPRVEGYYEVRKGLKEGDRVVTSANFLVDSESSLKAGLAGMEHEHGETKKEEVEMPSKEKIGMEGTHAGH